MQDNFDRHQRRSIRLRGYDYTNAGAYFVTIVTQHRLCLFGEVVDDAMQLSDAGMVVDECWRAIPDHFPDAALDTYVIMPNHVHGIIWIIGGNIGDGGGGARGDGGGGARGDGGVVKAKNFSPLLLPLPLPLPRPRPRPLRPAYPGHGATPFRSPSKTVGSMVRGFKIGVTKWMRTNTDIYTVWQRNYYEHIIRDEASLHRIRAYIATNPSRWSENGDNPARYS